MLSPAVAGSAVFKGTLTWGSRPQGFMLTPAVAGCAVFIGTLTWGSRPRLYAFARCRGLRVLFQFPDAFCNFDFLHVAEAPIVTILVRHNLRCGHLAVMWLDVLSA